jgi:hypothetical protein
MKIRFSFLLPALLFAAISLHATNLAPRCIANPLSAYDGHTSDFSVCSVGILNFDSFTFAATGTPGAVLLTDSQIELKPCNGVTTGDLAGACLVDPTSTSLNGGFSISTVDGNPFSVGAGQTETYTIDWLFDIDDGPEAAGASLGLDPVTGGVNVTQTYCLDSSLNPTPCTTPLASSLNPTPCTFIPGTALATVTPQTISVDNTNPPASLINSVTFGNPGLHCADVQTVITLTGGSGGASFDAVTGTATIVNTPEPAAFLLVASGLLLLGALRKRAAAGVV